MEELKNSFFLLAELSSVGIINKIGGKVFANLDFEPELLIGQRFADLVYWQHNQQTANTITDSITLAAEGKSLQIETTFRQSAENIINILTQFTPQISEDNTVKQIIFTAVDITSYISELNYHKHQSERFLYAAESADVGLWYWNITTGEMVTTPRCNKIYGFQANEIMSIEKFSSVFSLKIRLQFRRL